jgi:predicted MFS family arabinose efflux permease
MPKRKLTKPLGHPVFRRLGASYVINELGDWMGIVALSVLVFDRTGSALATAALFLGTRFLPALLAPIVVTKVEQPPPRFALPVIYCGEAAAFAALALFSGSDFSLAVVVALAAIDGTLALTGRSLTRAVIVTLLEPRDELRDGNALLNVALTISAAVGPALAGLIVAGFGVQTALLLDAISFYVIAWLLLTAGTLPHAKPEEGQTRERIRAGIAYLREQTNLRRLLLAQGAAFIFFAAVIPIEVVYAKETLGTSDSGYGIMLASWGAGMVVGSLLFASAQKVRLPVLLFFSTLAVGVGYLGLAAAPTLVAACGASVIGGTGNGVQWVSAISAVQELTAERMQARVMSVLWSISAAMPGLGYTLGALVAVAIDPRATFLIAGLGVFAIALLAALLLGTNWLESRENGRPGDLDAGDEIMVELIPVGESPVRPF